MLENLFFALGLSMMLASFGHCTMDSEMDNSNFNESVPFSSTRTSRNRKTANSCTTSDGFTGTCMSRFNCMRQGGAVSSYCGTYGVCCETNLACGGKSRQKTTIIKNPATLPIDSCAYIIEPYSSNVCQLRINFERFSMEQPTLDADLQLMCGDHLDINDFKICGNNDGQHIYVPFNVAGGMDHVQLEFLLPTGWGSTTWRLVVTQLECPAAKTKRTASLTSPNSLFPFGIAQNGLNNLGKIFSTQSNDWDLLAPAGCLQYYTERQGSFKSFNYNNFMGPYLARMTYAMCFKRSYTDSRMYFTATNFELSAPEGTDTENGPFPYDEQCHSTVATDGHRDDYLMIPQAMLVSASSIQPTYFCGTSIKSGDQILSATQGPFIVYFSSDDITDNTERGFNFMYRIQ